MDKRTELLALARKRQATRWSGYNCIGDYHEGRYECDYVSPYTKSANNVDAEIMVVLQDWSSDQSLSGAFDKYSEQLGHSPNLPTNNKLKSLLKEIFGVELKDIYATNLFPFIKRGTMTQSIPPRDLRNAAHDFTLPEIKIVKPKLVICLGLVAFNALREESRLDSVRPINSAIDSPFDIDATRVWCQHHDTMLSFRPTRPLEAAAGFLCEQISLMSKASRPNGRRNRFIAIH